MWRGGMFASSLYTFHKHKDRGIRSKTFGKGLTRLISITMKKFQKSQQVRIDLKGELVDES